MMGFLLSKIVKMCLLVAVLMMSSVAGHSYDYDSFGFHSYGHDNWKRQSSVESSVADILHDVQRRQATTSDLIVLCNQSPVDRYRRQDPPYDIPEYRYHVLIYGRSPLLCGGAVLSEYWLITSASCLEQLTGRIALVMGYQSASHRVGEQTFAISKIVKHHQYNASVGNDYDIALIKVVPNANGRGIQFTNRVQPICLPPLECTEPGSVSYKMTGLTRVSRTDIELGLHSVYLASAQRCINTGAQISGNQICATKSPGPFLNSCPGFVGGPVIYNTGGVYTLLGIVSSCRQNNVVVITSSQLFHCGFEIAD